MTPQGCPGLPGRLGRVRRGRGAGGGGRGGEGARVAAGTVRARIRGSAGARSAASCVLFVAGGCARMLCWGGSALTPLSGAGQRWAAAAAVPGGGRHVRAFRVPAWAESAGGRSVRVLNSTSGEDAAGGKPRRGMGGGGGKRKGPKRVDAAQLELQRLASGKSAKLNARKMKARIESKGAGAAGLAGAAPSTSWAPRAPTEDGADTGAQERRDGAGPAPVATSSGQGSVVVLEPPPPPYWDAATHRCGYVALIGRPNAGKSSLMNAVLGSKMSIVTHKAQTTRHRVRGISSEDDSQIIFLDTPGVFLNRSADNKMEDFMMESVTAATRDANAVVLVMDATTRPERGFEQLLQVKQKLAPSARALPQLLLLNKADLLHPEELRATFDAYVAWHRAEREATSGGGDPRDDVMHCSALQGVGTPELRRWIAAAMPLSPPLYPRDILGDQPEKFFVAEIVREKLFEYYHEEVPYACAVNVVRFLEQAEPGTSKKDVIECEIVAERDGHKGILIGAGGAALKRVSTAARKDIEAFLGRPVYLTVRVKVREKWRDKDVFLSEYGYKSAAQ